ncbi:NADH-quinone oxidoreductase subunit NuoK [Catellatospora sichuanensis]|uniref:NADH-quinone oxidoreductase subunit NuoK n=1 Tax=Catellatospora sichuanensis TaxID=1969805 RepID=UPI001183488E|nr:NADH-quinone oxidoreductase subunit NuoK [Catellatospora sichuanensis]
MRPVIPLVTAALLFGLGAYGVLRRRNAVLVLMSVELMLNAVNLVLVTGDTMRERVTGQVFALFVIVIAAAEVGVGLALVLRLFRLRQDINIDQVALDDEPRTGPPFAAPALADARSGAAAGAPTLDGEQA